MACPKLITLIFLVFLASSSSAFLADHHYHKSNDQFIECLQQQFKSSNSKEDGDLIFTPKNASSYASLLQAQNLRPASTSPERPLLILTPFHESQVQAAVYCSRKTGLQIRIRSGGHDYEGLSYTSRNLFVVVDMRNFVSIDIDTTKKIAWVEVGVTLGQLYYTIAKTSPTLAFTAGVCPTVGVGGHFSGGGYGMMSRRHSIAVDHIIDAKLIDAEGRILDRQSMGEDLFWAIRGDGSTSFGIIIAFKVELIDVPKTVTVFNVTRTSEQNATKLVHKWQYVASKIDERLLLRLFLTSGTTETNQRTIVASFTSLFLGRIKDLLPIMQEKFSELGLEEQDCIEMSWIESTLFFAELRDEPFEILLNRTPQGSSYFKGKSDYVQQPIPISALNRIWQFLHQEPENTAQLQFSPYGGVMNTYSESETPFPHRSGNIFMIHYAISWQNPNDAKSRMDWIRRLYGYMARYVSKFPRSAYFNYRDLDIGVNNKGNTSYAQASVWGLKYFNNNFKRLVQIKSKVDPSNLYRNEQSIPPITLW